jgi:putative DNA primase/helicase
MMVDTLIRRPGSIQDVLDKLNGVKKHDGWFQADCPVPGHKTPAGHLTIKDAGDKVLVTCHGRGHSYQDICSALNFGSLTYEESHRQVANDKDKSGGNIVATYIYHDENGKSLFRVLRYVPKRFLQQRSDGNGGWVWGLKDKKTGKLLVRLVLYNLPKVIQSIKDGLTVFIVEGEKDADNLTALGLIGTTNPGGARKWRDDYTELLAGASVIVVADKDAVGREHAHEIARSLSGKVNQLKILELPERNGQQVKDASDWLTAGGTRQELEQLIAETPAWNPNAKETQPEVNSKSETPSKRNILTDTTNAEFIAGLFGGCLRYDHLRNRWLLWNKHYWQQDADGEVYRLAIEAARQRYIGSVTISNLEERQRVAAWAISSEQRTRLDNAITLAKNIQPIADVGNQWDTDPWLLAVQNGVINLRTGKFSPGKPEDRITLHTGIKYDSSAMCPRWMQFLDEVFNGDYELINFIWRALGYSITGITTEQVYFMGYGNGANGKGRFLGTIRKILDDYAYDAPFSTFELTNRPNIPNDLAALERRRFVTSSETNEGARLNEARIKALTGEDPCTARYLHREFFTFLPVCKIWLAVNHKPTVMDDSYGFWRRVRLIPFTRQFRGESADKNLGEKLLVEASGILNWLIEGCLEWQRRGLHPSPTVVMSATEVYQTESDPLGQFITDKCVQSPQVTVKATELYKKYLQWADETGLREREKLSNNAFGRRMGQKFMKVHNARGTVYQGIGLVTDSMTDFEPMTQKFNVLANSLTHMEEKLENPS